MNSKTVYLVASGDLRLSANQVCWPAQAAMEASIEKALAAEGYAVKRAHPYDSHEKHGFINSQRRGIEVFSRHPCRCSADRCRSRVAVLAPRSGRVVDASRTDPDGRELERSVAPVWSVC